MIPIATTISILTFNTWMVAAPFNLASLDIDARAAALPAAVNSTGADIAAFQEVWPDKVKDRLASDFKKFGYTWSFHEDLPGNLLMKGLVGNGLLIVSKIPLEVPAEKTERVLAYSDFTRPDEYFANKGAVHVVARIRPELRINLYNTHLGAVTFDPLKDQPDGKHERTRLGQWNELSDFINRTKHGDPVVLMGDFNADLCAIEKPNDQTFLGLEDSFGAANRKSGERFTVDEKNLYRKHGPIYGAQSSKKTIDYVLVSKTRKLTVESSQVVFKENVEIANRDGKLPLSDHYGVLTKLKVSQE